MARGAESGGLSSQRRFRSVAEICVVDFRAILGALVELVLAIVIALHLTNAGRGVERESSNSSRPRSARDLVGRSHFVAALGAMPTWLLPQPRELVRAVLLRRHPTPMDVDARSQKLRRNPTKKPQQRARRTSTLAEAENQAQIIAKHHNAMIMNNAITTKMFHKC